MNRREAMGMTVCAVASGTGLAATGVLAAGPPQPVIEPVKTKICVNFRLVAWAKEEPSGGTSLHFVGTGDPIFVEESLQLIMDEHNLRSTTGPEENTLFFLNLTRVYK